MRRLLLLVPALLPLAALAVSVAAAQPQVPSSFYGSVSVDGAPVPDGTEVRGWVNGQDCTQLGPDYRGSVRVGEVSAFVIHVMHDAQKPGCGKPGGTVTFTIGGRPANESAKWTAGPQEVDLNAGQGAPPPLPTATPTSLADATNAAATRGSGGLERPTGSPPTDDIQLPGTPRPGGPGASASSAGDPAADEGGFPVVFAILLALGVIAVTGGAAGVALSRRQAKGPPPPPSPPPA